MSYCFDGQKLHAYICAAAGLPAKELSDEYAGVGKIANGQLVGAFTLRGLSGRVYEISGAVTRPHLLRLEDYRVMLEYLSASAAWGDAVIAFTETNNLRAQRILKRLWFGQCGKVQNFYGKNRHALLFELDLSFLRKDNDLKPASALAAKLH